MDAPAVQTDRISPSDVAQAMREAGAIEPSAELVDLRYQTIGIGHTADTFRVELTWAVDGAGPTSIIAKIPSTDAQSAQTAASLGAYEREAKFYEELAPRTELSIPTFYGVVTYNGERSGLLLEDLSSSTEPGDQFTDAAPDTVTGVRQQLVALQAPFWEDKETGSIPWLHRRLGVPIPGILERMERSWATARTQIAGGFEPDERAMIDRFVAGAGGWAESLTGPFSLTHHDYRFDNMLFGSGKVFVIDWQTVGWGVPMFDVAYLLGTSLSPSVRAVFERDEIRRHIDDLGSRGVEWSYEEAWNAYRQASFAVLLMLVPPTGSVKRTSRGDDMFRRLLRSGARMALDLDADEFLPRA